MSPSSRADHLSRWQRVALVPAVVAALVSAPSGALADGEPDPSYGELGVTSLGAELALEEVSAVAPVPGGGLVFLGGRPGTGGGDLVLVRSTPDGALDATFGDQGAVVLNLGGDEVPAGVAVQPNGRIVVAATRIRGTSVEFAVMRLTVAGEFDSTFAQTGRRLLDFGSSASSSAAGVALHADGRILVAGTRTNANGDVFAVARLTDGGELDTTFNGNGKRVVDFGLANGNDAIGAAVAVQDDGSVVVAGRLESAAGVQFALARLTPSGELDPGFGGNGKVTTDFGPDAFASAVTIAPTGLIVAAGTRRGSDDDFAVAVYDRDGDLATSFAGNGKRTTDFSADESAAAVTVQPDGRIVVVGKRSGANGDDFAVARYLRNGTLDSNLDSDGKLRFDLFPGQGADDAAVGVVVRPDGKLLVAGATRRQGALGMAAARLLSAMTVPVGALEIPGPDSMQSGVGLLSGWLCDARVVSVVLDGGQPLRTAYGTPRNDTRGACGDANNGFSLLFNWGLLGDGVHVARGIADGTEFARVVFRVTTLGVSFLRGASGTFDLAGFPGPGDALTLQWTQGLQRFVVVGAETAPVAPTSAAASLPAAVKGALENPAPGSAQSGVGIVSGWVCDAEQVLVRIDDRPPQRAGYGTARNDTRDACGDANNGFGLLVNWGLLGPGDHEVVVLADGEVVGSALFTVATFGVAFLRDASGDFTLDDFPETGAQVDLIWDERQQGFVVSGFRR